MRMNNFTMVRRMVHAVPLDATCRSIAVWDQYSGPQDAPTVSVSQRTHLPSRLLSRARTACAIVTKAGSDNRAPLHFPHVVPSRSHTARVERCCQGSKPPRCENDSAVRYDTPAPHGRRQRPSSAVHHPLCSRQTAYCSSAAKPDAHATQRNRGRTSSPIWMNDTPETPGWNPRLHAMPHPAQ